MQNLYSAVDKNEKLILDAERYIWNHAETGYREWETEKYMSEIFEKLGYTLTYAGNIPGFYTVIDTKKPGPEILILGEMDSLICPTHKDANKETGAVHACGHNAQCAALIGIAAALKEPGALDGLCGKIKLCAVPAEELIEIEYRTQLKNEGKIKYFGGKGEFLYRGYFDSSDIAFMVHTSSIFSVRKGAVGCIAKKVSYKGKSAHAGGAPWSGINSVYAASLGLNAANALRETFREDDQIRFHPIVTHGGEAVNAIPELCVIESYVRGNSFQAIKEANKKINRALTGAALSIGAQIDIEDTPGYAPLINDDNMMELAKQAAQICAPDIEFIVKDSIETGSTDMGELCSVMPVVHPYIPGNSGTSHGNDYEIADPKIACVLSAKWQLTMLKLLLENNAELANKIISSFKAPFTSKEEYFKYIDDICESGDRISYDSDKIATVKI